MKYLSTLLISGVFILSIVSQTVANQDGKTAQNTFIKPSKLSFIFNIEPKGTVTHHIIRTSDGGSLVGGYLDATRQVVTKLSKTGTTQWEQIIGSDTAAWITEMVEIVEQGYEIIGYTDYAAGPLMPKCRYVVRLGFDGVIKNDWEPRKGTKNVNRGNLNPIIRCRNGTYVTISAYSGSTTDSRIVPYFWRYDYSGNLIDEIIYDTVSLSSFYMTSFFQTKDQGYAALVVGWYEVGNVSKSKMELWRLDTLGKKMWSKDVCSWNASITYPLYSSMIQTSDGGFAIATVNNVTDNDTLHTVLYKYDADGNELSKSRYALSLFNAPYTIGETPSGNLLIGGFILKGEILQNNSNNINTKGTDYFLFKTTSNGELLWKDTFGDANSGDRVMKLAVFDEHTFLISGFTGSINNDGNDTTRSTTYMMSDLVSHVEEESLSSDSISISPNPISNTFTISGMKDYSNMKIMNNMGMEVISTSNLGSSNQEVDVSGLSSGLYFMQIRTPTGLITKPIVVSR